MDRTPELSDQEESREDLESSVSEGGISDVDLEGTPGGDGYYSVEKLHEGRLFILHPKDEVVCTIIWL